MTSRTKAKQQHWLRGVWAERIAAVWLQLKGYRILARRYKTPVGEIDLVVQRGRLLVAIEVKARATYEAGLHAVTSHQRKRILKTLQLYLTRHQNFLGSDLRFDVVVVKPWSWPQHLTNAWRAT